ncbi:hypothetical protein PS918_02401 [Pseudomonas fluorescens]|uniref:DUF4214 domain-containing protein n=1 Tax=Pseudomonas fluorescens TaxID=294 RepID=A0A5E7S6E4_PSEFL|nr:DUF4214 domain-containing protein [Pseudomonas fluorescens]VVP82126.1 hypothetical protein PS918_02401 [Pseudomonas fluorescens]
MTVLQTKLAELYISFFNRAPDSAGLAYWVEQLDKGPLTLEDISKNWMTEQAEGLAKYPSTLTDNDFITQIYQATLGRAPDAEGLAYWQDQLTNNSVGRDVFLAAVINGAKANTSAQGVLDAANLSNKATAGVAFADKGLNDLTLAAQVVASVNSNPDTLAAVQAVLKLVPAAAADVTPGLITLLTQTFDSIINLNTKAPSELGDLATYLTTVANQAGATTDLSILLANVATTVTKAATDTTALDNPAALAGDAVTAATPSTGGGPVTPTETVITSKVGGDNIDVTAHPTKVVVQFGQDKQALANAAQLIADQTDADALLATAEALQDTADATDAAALLSAASVLQITADQTDAVALQNTANPLNAIAALTDAGALQTIADGLKATADLTDAGNLQVFADALKGTADLIDVDVKQNVANAAKATADLTDADALQIVSVAAQELRAAYTTAANVSIAADVTADNSLDVADDLIAIQAAFAVAPGVLPADLALVQAATTDAEAIALITGFLETYGDAADSAKAAFDSAVADDAAATSAQNEADEALADDVAAASAQTAADNAKAADEAAATAQTAADQALADDQAAEAAQTTANDAAADDLAAATAQIAANVAVADDLAAANAQVAANSAVADDLIAANAQAAAASDAPSHSTLADMDLFTGFTIGTDKIDLLSVTGGAVAQPAGLERLADIFTADTGDLSGVLTTAFTGTAANKASMVVIENGTAKGTYLYVNDADAAFSATADVFIQLVGVTPGDVGQLKVGDYFA